MKIKYLVFQIAKTITRFWIGLSQLSTTSGFVWSDGTPVNFVNWAGGEPNNANGGENCAEMLASNSRKFIYFLIQHSLINILFLFLKAYGMVNYTKFCLKTFQFY